ncbi:MAG TPA: CoA transferase [Thermoanaerobaculia bacterium]|nr:CoA transferase [Thermoanaerobaculia bacterium]
MTTKPEPPSGPLARIRVVELASDLLGGVAVAYAGKLLADFGADVFKVEPPTGDPTRREGPFPPDAVGDLERSALFLYLNTSKRSIALDGGVAGPSTSSGRSEEAGSDPPFPYDDRATLQRLVERCDVLLHDRLDGDLVALGVDAEALEAKNPGLVVAAITPYGLAGPRAGAPAGELTVTHAAGLGNLLPQRSESVERAPVKLGGRQVAYHGGLVAALAILAALRARRRGGLGAERCARIDLSLEQVILAIISPYPPLTRYLDSTWCRVPDRPPAMGRVRTADGWVILNAVDDHHFAILRDLMGDPEWCAGDEWLSLDYRAHHLMDVADRIDEWASGQRKHELHERAGLARIPIGPIDSVPEVMENPQYRARGYFVECEHPRAGKLLHPGWPYAMSATPPVLRGPAPLLGEHGEEIRSELEAPQQSPGKGGRQAAASPRDAIAAGRGAAPPLGGIRVLELCWVWAGPYAGQVLAWLGADVIKVESHRRVDLMRRTVVWPLPEPRPRHVPPAQGMAFNSVNRAKRSVTLDLAHPQGLELARRLAALSDVVVDNMRPGALDKLGLGERDLRALREDVIVASSSGRGRGGPHTELLGYAMVHQGIGGGAYVSGYPDEPPTHSLGDVDIMNAVSLAFAILVALEEREHSGRGQLIDYSQCEGVSSLLGELFLGYQLDGVVPERQGNTHPTIAPHSVYPAWGVDRWIAIEAHDDDEWSRLASAMGRAELAADSRFATAAERKRNEATLDAEIAAWTSRRDRDSMVATLLAAGVRAAPSRNARDLYADPHLAATGAFETVQHPELGPIDLVSPPWRIEGLEHPVAAAPRLGEHTVEVLSELLGVGPEELERLEREGVIAPFREAGTSSEGG